LAGISFGIADFVLAVSVVSLAILGIITPQPAPAMIGLHPLAMISLFQMPLSIAIHALALRRLYPFKRIGPTHQPSPSPSVSTSIHPLAM
jgi:hypothetical protein